ncbi:MAG TPA: hypothetical protein V6D29_06830 [Leptolyngbyaceae cyanobacterium]
MQKVLPLALSAALSPAAIATAAFAVEPLDAPGPCWMIDEQGRVLDLVSLCGGYGSPSSVASSQYSARLDSMATISAPQYDLAPQLSPATYRRGPSAVAGMDGFWVRLVRDSENGAGRSGEVIGRPRPFDERDGRTGVSGSGGSSGGGNCDTPGDTASDGSSCGGRSAQSRPGGR